MAGAEMPRTKGPAHKRQDRRHCEELARGGDHASSPNRDCHHDSFDGPGMNTSTTATTETAPADGATLPTSITVPEHTVEIVSDSGEGAQKCGQLFGRVSARMGNGVWTVEIIPAEIQPPNPTKCASRPTSRSSPRSSPSPTCCSRPPSPRSTNRGYGLLEGLFFAVGAGLGLTLALVLMASIRENTELASVPELAKGMALVLIIAGSLSLASMGFAGLLTSS